ncbi:PAS domain S-box-containing protein [Litorivivens lipolytica]|uniref:histidine kinase n=1 Tax=Litorivivens lipolytica TaxID=1524264 RepID=A0A7W4W865_9GAMM|nr:ATP-binding protein [Litorivivens lipolytica]MBB3048659.1 PAS domain S-box-containing protein [Litorivivens lipolytica]
MRHISPLAWLTSLSAALTISIATIVLIGWHLDSQAMVTLGLSPILMHYNVAVAAVLSGLALLSLQFHRILLMRFFAALPLLIGTVHLLQYLTKARWNIDFWYLQLLGPDRSIDALNLAPTAAVALYLFNATLVFLPAKPGSRLGGIKLLQAASLAVLAIVAGSSWGILDQQQGYYGWGNMARMAPLSLLCFLLLAAAGLGLSALQRREDDLDGAMQVVIRLLVPLIMGASIVLWAELAKTESNHIREIMTQETAMTASGLQRSMRSQAHSLRRMAQRQTRSYEPNLDDWRSDARWYVEDHPGMIAIGYHTTGLDSMEWIYNDYASTILASRNDLNTLLSGVDLGDGPLIMSLPGRVFEDSSYFLLVAPIDQQRRHFVVAIFEGHALLTGIIPEQYLRHFHLELNVDGRKLFQSTDQRSEFYRYWAVIQSVDIMGRQWQLTVWPTRHYYSNIRDNLQDMVLIAGLIIVALLMYTSQLLERTALSARKLAISERRLSLLLESAGEGIYGLDTEGRTTFLNIAAQQLTGFSASEMVGKKQHAIIHHSHADGSDYPQKDCKIFGVLQHGGAHFERDEVFWHKNGHCFPVEYTASAITAENGEVQGAVVVFRDISDLKLMENKLKAINEELESFAYLASHDLKAPLRVISNASEWLAEDLEEHLRDEDRENMDLLQSRVKRMERLLDDLLQYSRIGRVTDASFQEQINGRDMMNNILELLSPPDHLSIVVNDGFAEVSTPRMPLQLILYNLIGNAIKHHDKPEGTITVGARTLGDDYEFCIEDDGPGIESRYHGKIFEIFRTLKPRDQVEGSGIGLSVVKKYVDLYGGRIELHSTVGEGSRFTIIWPKTRTGAKPQ